MDFNVETMKFIGTVFSIPLALLSLMPIYLKYNEYRIKRKRDLSDKYLQIKGLLSGLEVNYAYICVILSEITRARIPKEEIAWFINEPHAFSKIELYGQVKRFSKIEILKGEFALSNKYSTRKKRAIEIVKTVAVCFFYTIFSGAVLYLLLGRLSSFGLILATISWFFICCFMVWIIASFLSALDTAKKLCGKP